MPKHVDLTAELKKVNAQIKDDPTFHYKTFTSLPAPVYLACVEYAIENRMLLSSALAHIIEQHLIHLTDTESPSAQILQALTALWRVDHATAIQRLLEKCGPAMIETELESRTDLKKLTKAAVKAAETN